MCGLFHCIFFGSRWGPYCNKVPLSKEAFGGGAQMQYVGMASWKIALTWLRHFVVSMELLSMKTKRGARVTQCAYPSVPLFFHSRLLMLYFIIFLSKMLQTYIFRLPKLPDSGPADHDENTGCGQLWAGREPHPSKRTRTEPDPHLLPHCGFNVWFMQMHISWQCRDWPGIQTWSACGRAIILKCFYWSVDFLSPSFSSSLHSASLLKTPILSHTTKVV